MACLSLCVPCTLRNVDTQLLHPVMTNAAENLDMLFRKARLSQESAGEIVGVSGAQISKLLRPAQTGQVWSLRQLATLAECFGVTPQDLMGPGSDLLKRLPPPKEWKLPNLDGEQGPLIAEDPIDAPPEQRGPDGDQLPIPAADGCTTVPECEEDTRNLIAA